MCSSVKLAFKLATSPSLVSMLKESQSTSSEVISLSVSLSTTIELLPSLLSHGVDALCFRGEV